MVTAILENKPSDRLLLRVERHLLKPGLLGVTRAAESLETIRIVTLGKPSWKDVINLSVAFLIANNLAAVLALKVISFEDSSPRRQPVFALVAPLMDAGATLTSSRLLGREEL